jgi:nitroreductase
MELRDAIRTRRMIRSYDPSRPVSREQVAELLDLAVRAPSAGHTQGWQFEVLHSTDARERFWALSSSDGEPDAWLRRLRTAPVLVLCLSDKQRYLDRYAEPDKGWTDRDEAHWPTPYWHVDTGMAAMLLLLAAHDAGLAACFFGVPADRVAAVQDGLGLGELWPVGVVSLGHPAADLRSPSLRRGRRPFADVVRFR